VPPDFEIIIWTFEVSSSDEANSLSQTLSRIVVRIDRYYHPAKSIRFDLRETLEAA
jgi:hypothetical protein